MRLDPSFSRVSGSPRRRLPAAPIPVRRVLVAGAVGVALVALVVVMARLGPPIVLAVAGVALVARHTVRRRHPLPASPPDRAPATMPAPTPQRWSKARSRFARLQQDYAAYECDPLAVLRLPALADVRVPSTARFVDAFAEAQALDTDREPPAEHAARYAAAVDRACRAWQAAWDAAERIRLSPLSEQERASVERAIKLLTVARETSNDAERLTAYTKARAELARLERTGTVRLPRPARAALDEAARARLPGAHPLP
jgi:hypothetical protein